VTSPARHRRVDVPESREDALPGADCHGQQRQVGRDVGEALRVNAAVDAVALDAAQQSAAGKVVVSEPRHQGGGGEIGPGRHRLTEVDRELEGRVDHPIASESAQPAAVASTPATIEPIR
jgi:hypothetical protein